MKSPPNTFNMTDTIIIINISFKNILSYKSVCVFVSPLKTRVTGNVHDGVPWEILTKRFLEQTMDDQSV